MTTIATKYPFVGSIDSKQGGHHENQDNAGFIDTPLGLLLVVCDGMGGGPGGRTASLMAVDSILNVLSDVSEHTQREDALKFAIEKANDIIYAKAKDTPELRGMGTTVAAILINEDSALIAHAGDTRIYQLRKGTIVFRSADHSVVANLVRQKKITEEEARNHPQSNIVTRALGIRPSMEIEFDEVPFIRGDRFVICTDGIWGMMPQRDLVKSLSRVMGIGELTTSITEEIDRIGHANGGRHDNLTLAVVDTSFDSVQKKAKKKQCMDTSISSNEKNDNYSHKIRNMLFIFVVCVIIVVILFVYLNRVQHSNEKTQKQSQSQIEESTITIIQPNTIKIKEEDSTKQVVNTIDNQAKQIPKEKEGNPFLNPTLKNEQNKDITRQIIHVVEDLDNLKTIRGRNQEKTIKKKQDYVKNVIMPDVNHLGNKVINKKKKDISEIHRMLNDKKTVSRDWHGRTTKESNRHIEKIKMKVKSLQE